MTQIETRTIFRLIAAALILHLILIQPNHPGAMTWRALFVFPLELPVILFGLIALGHTRLSRGVRVVLVGALTLIAVLKVADLVSFNALSRGFNPVADLPLIEAFARLLTGALGVWLTLAVVIAAIAAIGLIAFALWWATDVWANLSAPPAAKWLSGTVAVLAACIAVAEIGHVMRGWTLPVNPPGAAFTARVGVERVVMVRRTLSELRDFKQAVTQDPFSGQTGLLDAIDRDVIVIFIESYGRTSLDTPFYADLHRKTLADYDTRLSSLGLSLRSGVLKSPTQGGQSWLAHSTFSNGMWIDNQIRYGAALSSGRDTLFHHAQRNGFHTGAVMPQITLDWPEADVMGFDTILPAKKLGYNGLPFNWVTMPDQFTLAALDRLLRDAVTDKPVFAQVALASSHAPWTPVPKMVPWDALGTGEIFNEMALSGDPPDVVWRDRDRVRLQYKLAIDYSLQSVFAYAERHAEDPPLLIILGDHQAAEFVALDDRPEVPIHIVGPEHLVSLLSEVAPEVGLLPDDNSPVMDMDRLRDILLNAFTSHQVTGVVN